MALLYFVLQMKKLGELNLLLLEDDPGVSMTVQSWAMVSLADVFKDVIPAYKIRLPTDIEKRQKVAIYNSGLFFVLLFVFYI